MDLGLSGRVAVVTAASKGLGRAVAAGFAAEGASVAICGRSRSAIEATAQEIQDSTGSKVMGFQADVSSREDISLFIGDVANAFGRIDTLVCNAGGPAPGKFSDLEDLDWEAAVQLTMMSAIRLIRSSLPHLRNSDSGRIIYMSSSSIKQPIPGLILSNTMRLGLQGMVKTLSHELAEDQILINTVAPGRFDTDRVRGLDAGRAAKAGISVEDQRAQTQEELALGRYGEAEEFARYAVFLGSPANTYVTGQALLVDGGLTKSL